MFLAAPAAVGLIGTGISSYAQFRQGREQSALSRINLAAQTQANSQQQAIAAMQARFQQVALGQQQKALQTDAANERTAAEYETRAAQENIRRSRDDFARALASQRAAIAARGILSTTGSPLEMLLQSAEDQALSEADARTADELNRRSRFSRAGSLDYQARVAGLNKGMATLQAAAQRQSLATSAAQYRLDAAGQRASAGGQYLAGFGTLLSGVSDYRQRRSELARLTNPV
jgi:hypothetical protein